MKHQTTGDPFIDAGGLAMEAVWEYEKLGPDTPENRLSAIEWAARVYQNKWGSGIDSVSLNGVVTHSSRRRHAIEAALKFYREALADMNPYTYGKAEEGWCRGCGRQGKIFNAGRDILPISGSGAFLNFHHAHDAGVFLCKHCLVALFFLPLTVMQCGKNLAMLQTQTPPLREFWQKSTIAENFRNLATGKSEGILRSPFSNVQNALFALANEIVDEWHAARRSFEAQDLRLFYFTNYGPNPECEIYDLPADVFSFIWVASHPKVRSAWRNFVRRFYRIREAAYNENAQQWEKTRGKAKGLMREDDYRNNPNDIYKALLGGRNILRMMYLRKERKLLVPIEIPLAYLMEVRRMKKERIETVLALADRVCELVQAENAPKMLYPIESARFPYQFRAALLKLFKKNMQSGSEKPLFTTDDYLYKICPDGEPWSDVRDLMLIRIYEKLHDFLQKDKEAVSDETIAVPEVDLSENGNGF